MPDLATSWTRRLFEQTGIATVWLGIALLTIAVLVLVVQELALGRLATVDDTTLERVRITFTHIVITAYLITAYVYCEQARDESIASLRPLLDPERADPLVDTKTRDRAILPLAALIGVAGSVWVGLNVAPDPGSYDPRDWTPETGWHRVLSIFMGFWTGRLSLLIVIESGRLSDLAATLREIDLLDLNALAPFARSGLTNALLVIGSVAVYALFLVDIAYLGMVALLLVLTLTVGSVALLLPLRGVRDRVRAAKQTELTWVRERLRGARADLKSGNVRPGELQELVAWESRVATINEWTVDASTFTRFALYLLTPLGSWAGGALVERMLDSVLE